MKPQFIFLLVTLAVSLPLKTLKASETDEVAQLKADVEKLKQSINLPLEPIKGSKSEVVAQLRAEVENLKIRLREVGGDSSDSKCWFSGNQIFKNGQPLYVGDAGDMIDLIDSGTCTYRDEPKDCSIDWHRHLSIATDTTLMASDYSFRWFRVGQVHKIYVNLGENYQTKKAEKTELVIAQFRRLIETLGKYGLCKVSQHELGNYIDSIYNQSRAPGRGFRIEGGTL